MKHSCPRQGDEEFNLESREGNNPFFSRISLVSCLLAHFTPASGWMPTWTRELTWVAVWQTKYFPSVGSRDTQSREPLEWGWSKMIRTPVIYWHGQQNLIWKCILHSSIIEMKRGRPFGHLLALNNNIQHPAVLAPSGLGDEFTQPRTRHLAG